MAIAQDRLAYPVRASNPQTGRRWDTSNAQTQLPVQKDIAAKVHLSMKPVEYTTKIVNTKNLRCQHSAIIFIRKNGVKSTSTISTTTSTALKATSSRPNVKVHYLTST
jgi:hypothetical protein